MANSDTVYLFDASIYIFRAWFGYPDSIVDTEGRPVNAVYGYWRLLLQQLNDIRPTWMLAAFDESLFSGFRHQLYPEYKANRALPDAALAHQLTLCRLLTEQLGLFCQSSAVFEADDVLATAATIAHGHGHPVTIVSRDKDLAQLIRPGDYWSDWAEGTALDHSALCQRWGVDTACIPDVLALAGDAVDNIPGVRQVGLKTATQLIRHFGDIENLFRNIETVSSLPIRGAGKLQERLMTMQSEVFLFRELIRLHPVDEPPVLTQMKVIAPEPDVLRAVIASRGLGRQFVSELERYSL